MSDASASRGSSYCVIGNPVAHSRSPAIHRQFADLTGEPVRYTRLLAPLDGFAATVAQFIAAGGLGCNVTVPFKTEAFALATQRSARAQLAGAANTLTFQGGEILADNTDGAGLVRDICHNLDVPLAGRAVLLIGAGGAAAGALGALLAEKPARLLIVNRTAEKAKQLAARHAELARDHGVALASGALDAASQPFDAVINATASSLHGSAIAVNSAVLRPGSLALDMMYGPAAQPFIDWARNLGATATDGLGMLVEQAAESFRIWRGVRPPTAPVLASLRAQLADDTQQP